MKKEFYSKFLFLCILLLPVLSCGGGGGGGGIIYINAPTGISVFGGDGYINLSWQAVSNADSYKIYMHSSSGVSKSIYTSTVSNSSNSYKWSSLTNNVTYYFVVTSLLSGVESHESFTVSAKPRAIFIPPVAINAVADDGKVVLSWNSLPGLTYNVYWSTSNGVSKSVYSGKFQNLTSTLTHSSLANGTTYYYVITAVNGASESSESLEVSSTPVLPSGLDVTINGSAFYEDKEYDLSGFTAIKPDKPVRYAIVEVVESSTSNVLASSSTDFAGNFSITYTPSPVSAIYMRLFAETTGASNPPVRVMDVNTAAGFTVAGADFTPSIGTSSQVQLFIPVSSYAAGAFNIMDVFTYAGEFIKSLEGSPPSPEVKAYWNSGNWSYGTYFCDTFDAVYCPNGDGTYILGGDGSGGGDTDEYDDDVLLHEYGHYAASLYSRDDSQGGSHWITDNDLDMRLSWSEGWCHFMLAAVKEWMDINHPGSLSSSGGSPITTYVDTDGTGASFFDINVPLSSMIYSSNEVAVANALWNSQQNTFSAMSGIWNAFADYMPNTYDADLPANLEAFWDGWLTTNTPSFNEYSTFEAAFADRQIDYSLDAFESDNTGNPARKISVGAAENHTIYKSYSSVQADLDYVAFDGNLGVQYTISTSELKNGADTIIRVLNSSLVPIAGAYNDNANGLSYFDCIDDCPSNDDSKLSLLASELNFIAPSTQTYYVEIKSSVTRPDSSGRYGSYTLRITSP